MRAFTKSNRGRRWAGALRAFCVLALGVMATVGWSGQVQAHAIIQSATPAAGSKVAGPDVDVALRFNSRLDLRRSRLSLTLPDGSRKPLSAANNPAEPAQLGVRLQGLASGGYVLHWQVLAVDGHMTRGNIPFTVGER